MRIRDSGLFVLAFLLLAHPAAGQQDTARLPSVLRCRPAVDSVASLSGIVRIDSAGRPAPWAQVRLPNLDIRTHADSIGRFSFDSLASGSYVVTVGLIGYNLWTDTISIPFRNDCHLQLALRRSTVSLSH